VYPVLAEVAALSIGVLGSVQVHLRKFTSSGVPLG